MRDCNGDIHSSFLLCKATAPVPPYSKGLVDARATATRTSRIHEDCREGVITIQTLKELLLGLVMGKGVDVNDRQSLDAKLFGQLSWGKSCDHHHSMLNRPWNDITISCAGHCKANAGNDVEEHFNTSTIDFFPHENDGESGRLRPESRQSLYNRPFSFILHHTPGEMPSPPKPRAASPSLVVP